MIEIVVLELIAWKPERVIFQKGAEPRLPNHSRGTTKDFLYGNNDSSK